MFYSEFNTSLAYSNANSFCLELCCAWMEYPVFVFVEMGVACLISLCKMEINYSVQKLFLIYDIRLCLFFDLCMYFCVQSAFRIIFPRVRGWICCNTYLYTLLLLRGFMLKLHTKVVQVAHIFKEM